MTTSVEVRNVWQSSIWEAQEIADLTPNWFLEEVVVDSQFELDQLKFDADDGNGPLVNYFQCLVSRKVLFGEMKMIEQQFDVQVLYHLQQTGVADSNYNRVQDNIETMDSLVLSALGVTWGNTVDFYTQTEGLRPERVTIADLVCWRGGYRYTAFKRTNF